MSISTKRIVLDVDKSGETDQSIAVAVRQGDRNAERLEIGLENCGEPLPMVGRTARLMATLPDGSIAVAACTTLDASTGKVSCVLGPEFGAARGLCKNAYVEVREGSTVVGSTERFAIDVLPGADMSAAQAASYVSSLEALETRAEGLADGLEETIASADITVSATRLDPGSDPTATVTGGGLAKHVELGIPSAAAGVSCEAGPAGMVTVHGAAGDAPLVEATVFGETRQNLWKNPNGTARGVSISTNEDGSFTVSGTATLGVSINSGFIYNLKQNTIYTESTNIKVSSGCMLSVYFYNESSVVGIFDFGRNETSRTFTSPENFTTASGTYRVMLNEGATPAPWSPPGLASVEGVEVASSGRNMSKSFTSPGLPNQYTPALYVDVPLMPDTEYTISCKGAAGNYVYMSEDIVSSYKQIVFTGGRDSLTFSTKHVLGQGAYYPSLGGALVLKNGGGNTVAPSFSDVQVEVGGSATEYAPPSLTRCPVPLPAAHPYLASLPDGTRDELRINWDGTAELVANTFTDTVNGSSPIISDINNGRIRFKISSSHEIGTSNGAEYSRRNAFCNKLKVNNDPVNNNNSYYNIAAHEPNSAFYFNLGKNEDSLDKAKTWLSSNELIILYKIASPIHYFYDGTAWSTTRPAVGSLPALRSAGDPTHVWAVTEPSSVPAEVSAHVLLEGGKALGAEHDYVRRAVDALAAAQSVSESE